MRLKGRSAPLSEELGQVKPRVSKGYGVTTPLLGRARRPSLGLSTVEDVDEEDEVDEFVRKLVMLKTRDR
jgi:hypothetical protein